MPIFIYCLVQRLGIGTWQHKSGQYNRYITKFPDVKAGGRDPKSLSMNAFEVLSDLRHAIDNQLNLVEASIIADYSEPFIYKKMIQKKFHYF